MALHFYHCVGVGGGIGRVGVVAWEGRKHDAVAICGTSKMSGGEVGLLLRQAIYRAANIPV
eukprot:2028510-Prorocentrum_lima.AAC.1